MDYPSISEFAPLIQLIVGSIFLNEYYSYSRNWQVLDAEQKRTIKQKTPSRAGLVELFKDRKLENQSDSFAKKLSKSVAVVLVLYGCICLYYCAMCHNDCGCTQYRISCLGPMITTIITFVYIIWAFLLYGHNFNKWHDHFTNIIIVLLIISFVSFFIVFPNVLSDALEDGRSFVTLSILITLLCWFSRSAKRWILIKFYVPYWMNTIKYLPLLLPGTTLTSYEMVTEILETISNVKNEKFSLGTRLLLIKICRKYLKHHDLYCRGADNLFSLNSNDIKTRIENVKQIIIATRISNYWKRWLIRAIPSKKVHICLSSNNDPIEYSVEKGTNIIKRLARFGAYEADGGNTGTKVS